MQPDYSLYAAIRFLFNEAKTEINSRVTPMYAMRWITDSILFDFTCWTSWTGMIDEIDSLMLRTISMSCESNID